MDETILVRGSAERSVPPDHATIELSVSVHEATADATEQALAAAAARLDGALDEHASALSDRAVTALRIQPHTYWHSETGRQIADGYDGRCSVRIRVGRPARAGAILRAVYAATAAEVTGPRWGLRDGHPVWPEVRAAAARDARDRASAYAEGLGVQAGAVAFVAEPGLRTGPGGIGGDEALAVAAMRADDTGQGAPVLDLAADTITVSATVEVGFRISR